MIDRKWTRKKKAILCKGCSSHICFRRVFTRICLLFPTNLRLICHIIQKLIGKIIRLFHRRIQKSKMKLLVKIVNGWRPSTNFAKRSILDVWLGSQNTCFWCECNQLYEVDFHPCGTNSCYHLTRKVFFMIRQGIIVWVCFNSDRVIKDQTATRICSFSFEILTLL